MSFFDEGALEDPAERFLDVFNASFPKYIGLTLYSYLPDDAKHDWKRIKYMNWNKGLEPLSICAIPGVN